MPTSAERPVALDLAALDAITEAVESGAGLPDVVRAAARALDASLVLLDRSGSVLAVAARSPADERSLLDGAAGVETIELRVADTPVGQLRMRARSQPGPALVRLVTTLVASEVERVRAPGARLAGGEHGVSALDPVARARPTAARSSPVPPSSASTSSPAARSSSPARTPTCRSRRAGARACWRPPSAARAPSCRPRSPRRPSARLAAAEVIVLVPSGDDSVAKRAAEGVLRELQAGLPGHSFAIGRSRVALDPLDLHRAGNEALLAVNVAEGDEERPLLAFEQTGAYRLLLSAMSEDPAELQRFYAETVEPLVAYDEQYETDLVRTVEAFLDNDGNVAGTAQKLFTHRHTIRYRLERVRELSGLDVGSTDGREKLSLGLKAMRVLGVAAPGGPATEPGTGAGRVPKR